VDNAYVPTAPSTVIKPLNILDFGAVGNGVADDTGAIQDCIDAVGAAGGGVVYIPAGVYLISSTLTVAAHGVTLLGDGAGAMNEDTVAQIRDAAVTRILFDNTATPAKMVEFTSLAGGPPLAGGGMQGIMLDGDNTATRCLSLATWREGRFVDLYLYAATSEQLWTGCISGTLSVANYSTRSNHFERVRTSARLVTGNTAYGARLTGGQGAGSTVGGNTCFNTFITCAFFARDGIGLKLENTDNNVFINCEASRTTGSAYSVELGSVDQDSGGFGRWARSNFFYGGEYIHGVHARSSQTGATSSQNNVFYGYSQENGGAVPVVETPAGGSTAATVRVFTMGGKIDVDNADYAELSSAPSNPSSGLRTYARNGQIHVRTTAGAVRSIDPLVARKTSATVRNNTATLADDPHLSVSVVSGGVYEVEALLFYIAATTADVKIGWSSPASSTFLWGALGATSGAAPTSAASGDWNATNAAGTRTLGGGTVSVTNIAHVLGTLTAGADGTLTLQWAQGTAEVSDATLSAGSRLSVRRIA
jgi:hypothetical protein